LNLVVGRMRFERMTIALKVPTQRIETTLNQIIYFI
jgi:hypothetical protein